MSEPIFVSPVDPAPAMDSTVASGRRGCAAGRSGVLRHCGEAGDRNRTRTVSLEGWRSSSPLLGSDSATRSVATGEAFGTARATAGRWALGGRRLFNAQRVPRGMTVTVMHPLLIQYSRKQPVRAIDAQRRAGRSTCMFNAS